MTYISKTGEVLYHEKTGFPQDIISLLEKAASQQFTMKLEFTKHALERAATYGCTKQLPAQINWADIHIFEIGIVDGVLDKVVARLNFDNKNDVVFVLSAGNRKVRTLWLNRKTDQHKTLDLSKYAIPAN